MTTELSWSDYVLAQNLTESAELWDAALTTGSRAVLVCGAGFDPRTLDVPRALAARTSDIAVLALELGATGSHDDAVTAAAEHELALRDLFGDRLSLVVRPDVEDPSSQYVSLTRTLVSDHDLLGFDTVIVDLSGLPSMVSSSVLQLLLLQAGSTSERFSGNLLAVASEDPLTDSLIVASELDEPEILSGFGELDDRSKTKIWIPVLGRIALDELRLLSTFLDPNEVCAVVPFPSMDPRTGDDLLLEHRGILFEEFGLEPRNVFYASESNPFDLYRQLVQLADRYRRALRPLGEAAVIVSEHTSKMLGLGIALAAHESGLTIAYVRPNVFRYDGIADTERQPTISTAWLLGAAYEH